MFQDNLDEGCLAILNNLYDDGIKWHDVACYHKKPIICREPWNLLGIYFIVLNRLIFLPQIYLNLILSLKNLNLMLSYVFQYIIINL